MGYEVLQPPFTLRFGEMSRKELEGYRAWFHEVMPARVAELTRAVKATPGFASWEPDRSVESLEPLGRWFEGRVRKREKTSEEIEETRARLVFPIEIQDWQLTDETFSLAMDIGMYFGSVIVETVRRTRWEQPLGNKKFVDYGQPVIAGFGQVTLNPVRVLVMTAYGIADGEPAALRKLYHRWAAKRQ